MHSNNIKIAVIGMGNIGLSVATSFSEFYDTLGYDVNEERIKKLITGMQQNDHRYYNTRLKFSDDEEDIKGYNIYIITVPIYISNGRPDLESLIAASKAVAKVLNVSDVVIYETTVYPGVTEEVCIPILEKYSGLTSRQDFKVGYSPERLNFGDSQHNLSKIAKIVSGQDQEALDIITDLYKIILNNGVFRVSSIRIAETAKLVENIQRDVNIALINEIAVILGDNNINTAEVLSAARSKWNFCDFKPGLVGGNCLDAASYLFSYFASKNGRSPQIINVARKINDNLCEHLVNNIITHLIKSNKGIENSLVTILGVTYKANYSEVRYSPIKKLINTLQHNGIKVQIHDPVASESDAYKEYGLALTNFEDLIPSSAMIITVAHNQYYELTVQKIMTKLLEDALLVDIPSILCESAFNLHKSVIHLRL